MSSMARSLYRSYPINRLVTAIHQKRITFRHAIFAIIAFLTLWTLYSFLLPRPPAVFLDDMFTTPVSPETWQQRASHVKRAFQHAYTGYERYALPYDELKPVSDWKSNSFNGWGVSVFDSLDTMILMGLDDEFKRALPVVEATNFTLTPLQFAPFFETVIRYLGGLLSAYALSREPILLTRADDLARLLSPAFNTSSGFPYFGVNTVTGQTKGPAIGILAEIATCQLEYTYLAKETGNKTHFDRADIIIKALANADLRDFGGMAPVRWNLTSGEPYDGHLSVGAQADSTHEYLLKQYLLTGKTDANSLRMYIDATNYILSNLLYVSPTRHLLYVTDTIGTRGNPRQATHTFEHLSCFLPGLLALGAHTLPLDNLTVPPAFHAFSSLRDLHMWAAEGLGQTCWLTYADQVTGLGPDVMVFRADGAVPWVDALARWKRSGARGLPPGMGLKSPIIYDERERVRGPNKGHSRDYINRVRMYLLRPETVESMYLLWRVTGDPSWRVRGWAIFEAIERETKTASGYASIKSVEVSPPPMDDNMPSYFLAETLKYLYLMFIDDDPIPLDKWVFNTEAHPLPVFDWTNSEKIAFGIS